MKIGDRIRNLRIEQGLTQEEVGNCIGVNKATVMRYENGEIDIKRTVAIKLAGALHTTPAYIMGWDNRKNTDIDEYIAFGERLQMLRNAKGLSQKSLAQELGMPQQTYQGYESGKRKVNLHQIQAFADYFNVPLDCLTGTEEASGALAISSHERESVEKYRACDNYGKGMIDTVLDHEYDRCKKQGTLVRENSAKIRILEIPEKPIETLDEELTEYAELPLYDEPASAGLGNYLNDGRCEPVQYPAGDVPPKANMCVRIAGDSMEPDYVNGSIVFVEARPAIESGQIGIFTLNGESFCKKLILDYEKRETILRSYNPKYDDIKIKEYDELRTIGRVLGKALPAR